MCKRAGFPDESEWNADGDDRVVPQNLIVPVDGCSSVALRRRGPDLEFNALGSPCPCLPPPQQHIVMITRSPLYREHGSNFLQAFEPTWLNPFSGLRTVAIAISGRGRPLRRCRSGFRNNIRIVLDHRTDWPVNSLHKLESGLSQLFYDNSFGDSVPTAIRG